MNRSLFILSLLIFSSFAYAEEEYSSSPNAELLSEEEDLELEEELLSLEQELLSPEETAIPSAQMSTDDTTSSVFSSLEEVPVVPLIQETIQAPSFSEDATPVRAEVVPLEEEQLSVIPPPPPLSPDIQINLFQVLSGSPFIYSLLLILSVSAIAIWFYSMSLLRKQGDLSVVKEVREKLLNKNIQEASEICCQNQTLFSRMVSSGLACQKHGIQAMLDNMRAEGKRATISAWQRLNLLQDIVIIAPMLGLLGTVLGMFYAFYDLNRSVESIANLFDGFGISVGTTVAGIGVAILAMILHSMVKFRLIRALARVESEAVALVHIADERQ